MLRGLPDHPSARHSPHQEPTLPTTLVAAHPVHAHLAPLLPVAAALVASGRRVLVLSTERFRAQVEATGAELVLLPDDAWFDERTLDQLPGRATRTGIAALRWDLTELFVGCLPAQTAAIDAVLDAEPDVDALVFDPLFLGAYAVTTRPRDRRPRTVAVGIVPAARRYPGVPPFGPGLAPMPGLRGRVRDTLVRLAIERVALRSAQVVAERTVRSTGATPPPGFLFDWGASADVVTQLTVPGFEYPRPALGDRFRLVGPTNVPRPGTTPVDPEDLPGWWGDLDDRTVVHVTQGTVANVDVGQLLRPTLEALADEDVLVVAATGGAPVADLGPLPANVRAARMLPYAALLPRTSVMVTNGGYGGVHWALAHGVPLVVAGATEDKAEVGARVAWSGVGVRLKGNRPSPQQVRDAVRTVLTERCYRVTARVLAHQVAASPGAAGVVEAVAEASTPARR